MLKQKKTYKGLCSILVTSMIGAGTFSYIPTVYAEGNQPSIDEEFQLTNTLSKLEMEEAALDQAFSANINTYTATVGNEVSSIQLIVEAASTNSSITINGQTVTNGKSDPIPLQTGENTILITVSDSSNQPNTYTLTITRKKSENNLLSNINLSKGELSPKFDPNIIDYNVEVGNEVESITVNPEAVEKTESIKVKDTILENEGVTVELPVGTSDIPILVTAENGSLKTYFLRITRAAKQTYNLPSTNSTNKSGTSTRPSTNSTNKSGTSTRPSANSKTSTSGTFANIGQQQSTSSIQKTSTATLSSMTVSEGTWDSSFSNNEYTYHIALSSDVNSVTINPVAAYSSAAVSIEGSSTKTVILTGSKTAISILVTRGEDRKTYVLVFDKPIAQTQTETTTLTTQQSASVSTSTKEVSNIVSGTTEQKVRQNKTTTSIWATIKAFFNKFF